jgi:two-component system, NarL family, sensor histidine kinase UhpB
MLRIFQERKEPRTATKPPGLPPPLASEARDRLLARVAFEATWERDLGGDELSWDANLESIFGYPRDEVVDHLSWWRDRVHPDDIQRVEETSSQAINSDAAGWSSEYRFRRRDGSWAWVASRCAIERDDRGQARRAVGAMIDVSRLKESESLLRQVLDTLPVGVMVLDPAGDIVLGNPAADHIWGGTIVSGPDRWVKSKGYWHASGRAVDPADWASRHALDEGRTSRDELIDIETFDNRRKTIENYAAPIRDGAGTITGAVVVNQDVTERVSAEEALRNTERLLIDAEKLGQTGSWEQDLIRQQIVNTEANLRLFFGDDRRKGARLEDYVEAVHPDDRDWVMRQRGQLLAGTGSGDIEYRVVWPNGSVHWIFGRATVVRDESGRPIRVYGTNADITERKHAEEELARRARQQEALSRKLIEAQEAERRAVARELHDDFGQVLTALKLNLQRRDRDDAESIALVDGAIARMRDLAQDLRPPLLDEFGLEASLSWYVEREAKRAGLAFRLSLAHLEKRPPIAVETTCFRIAQEALTNVIRHAQARGVDVELSQGNGTLQLVVRDDGHGFDVAAARRRAAQGASQGLLSMQERVALAGGALEIDSAPGRGTAIRARLPLATGGGGP